ncbi:MAG: hypothetical protein RLZZ350_2216 [Verrucomicrobiota bacterium]|jgi:hypothetical protein
MKRLVKKASLAAFVVFVILQFIKPVGKNPPVATGHDFLTGANPPPAEVARLLRAACYDCHSHETRWPWYGRVAPVSWWLVDHIQEGREKFNFSDWPNDNPAKARKKISDLADEIAEGTMPLKSYTWMHADARLTDAQKKLLADWADGEMEKLKASDAK